jgi:putative aldouronate transport system permease protein
MVPVTAASRRKIDISLYLMLIPALVLVIIYAYGPLGGLIIAFKRYDIATGILNSPWVGLENFKTLLFKYVDFKSVLFNTVYISGMKLVATFIAPIVVAILLNEVYNVTFKKSIQTLIYLPYFMSWVIIAGIMMDILSPNDGILNNIIKALGFKPIYFLGQANIFPFVVVISDVWKGFGFGTIIYMAALTGIDPSLYEAAIIDGANRFQRIKYITIPGIVPIMVLLGTLSLGYILNAGFEQIFNLYNPLVYSTGDILDTFTYRIGIVNSQYDMATTVGLFKSAVSIVMVSTSYYVAYKVADYRIF